MPDFVQEPDTLITAPPVPKRDGRKWMLMKIHHHFHVGGEQKDFKCPISGVVGYLPVFDDYEKALAFAEGDTRCIVSIEPI